MKQESHWQRYYKNTATKPPNPLLQKAVVYVQNRRCALDLGAGALRDTKYLLECGFEKVVAIDSDPTFSERVRVLNDSRVVGFVSTFDEFVYPENDYDLVSAQWSLPFNPKSSFNDTFKKIKRSLKPDGVFVGQLFGVHDEWNLSEAVKSMTFLLEEEVRNLFVDMKVLSFKEDEKDAPTASGETKHWHVFYVIARK